MTLADTPPKEPSSRWAWITLGGVLAIALGLFIGVWVAGNPSKDTLWYEVAKTSLQVIAVTVIGGIVTIATSKLQHNRQLAAQELEAARQKADKELEAERHKAAQELEDVRQKADKELERQREEFDMRTALLSRTSRCAQKMFVTCQHARRVQSDSSSQDGQDMTTDTRLLLDDVYREFSVR
jgi:hypothetical protein